MSESVGDLAPNYVSCERRVEMLAGQEATYLALPMRPCAETEAVLSLLEAGASDKYAPSDLKPRAATPVNDMIFARWLEDDATLDVEDADACAAFKMCAGEARSRIPRTHFGQREELSLGALRNPGVIAPARGSIDSWNAKIGRRQT